ncbi:MAG: T9SS type A sorting domain-containing protein [Bacteroidales bacterium]|nr:T9SS type A sorting domain-containing protein [Bacteroidales bacterium]
MKKLLLSTAILLSVVFTNAQSFSITYESVDVTNDTVFLSIPLNTNIDAYFHINNLTSSTIAAHVQRYVECAPSSFTHLWCFGSSCYAGNVFGINADVAGSSYTEFHVGPVLMSENTTGYTFRYTFYPVANPADSVWVWLVNDPNGDCTSSRSLVDASQTKAKVYPNPADNYTDFEFKLNSVNSRLDIYNIIGEKVKSISLNKKEGVIRLNTANLPAGTYIGNVIESGIRTKSIKIIVSH